MVSLLLFALGSTDHNPGTKRPCPAINVPGRTFPVVKRYLNKIVELELSQYTKKELDFLVDDERARNSTKKYLEAELTFASDREGSDAKQNGIDTEDWKQEAESGLAAPIPESAADSIVPHRLIAFTIAHICKTSSTGAILVFLPGIRDLEEVDDLLRNERPLALPFDHRSAFRIIKLHSTLRQNQNDAFMAVPNGCRKILLSTNIAETSITIPEVRFGMCLSFVKLHPHSAPAVFELLIRGMNRG